MFAAGYGAHFGDFREYLKGKSVWEKGIEKA